MSIHKPQSFLAAPAEFAPPKEAKHKERMRGVGHEYKLYVPRAKSNWVWVRLMNIQMLK